MQIDVDNSKNLANIIKKLEVTFESDENSARIECQSNEHKCHYIREGNRTYIVLSRDKNEWSIDRLICTDCTVRSSVERLTGSDIDVAIIEATPTYNSKSSKIEFKDAKLWDIIEN